MTNAEIIEGMRKDDPFLVKVSGCFLSAEEEIQREKYRREYYRWDRVMLREVKFRLRVLFHGNDE